MRRNLQLSTVAMALFFCSFVYSAREETIPLRQFATLNNIAFDRFCFRLARAYVQSDERYLCFEAEEASALAFHGPEKKTMPGKEVSGGYYVDFVKEMQFSFKVTHPGKYRAWYRAYFPLAGSWNHGEEMDSGEVFSVMDSNFGPIKEWLWVKGPLYDLAKGEHVYLFPSPSAWCGGAKLDKVVLAREGIYDPEDLGPSPSKLTTPQEGQALAKRLRLNGIRAWRVTFEEKRLNGGQILLDYSMLQSSGPWKQYPLETISPSVKVEKSKELWLRVRIKGKAGSASPQLRGLSIVMEKSDAA